MVVVTLMNCPPKLRGDLTKWLLEVSTGVYCGNLSARVRDLLWKRICDNVKNGQATMVFTTNNEQHFDFYVHNTSWQPIDLDGIKLLKHPNPNYYSKKHMESTEIEKGYSIYSKRRMVKRMQEKHKNQDYMILDLETTGLSSDENEIIEIGLIDVRNGLIYYKNEILIKPEKGIPKNITEITGITEEMIAKNGKDLKSELKKLFILMNNHRIVGYNIDFDIRFLEAGRKKFDLKQPSIVKIDVLETARSKIKDTENYRLYTIAEKLGFKVNERHRAMADCELLFKVYSKLNEMDLT